MKKYKLVSLISAISIYIFVILVIIVSLTIKKDETKLKSTIYTTKKSDIIEVSLGSVLPKSVKKNNKIGKTKDKKKDKQKDKKNNLNNKKTPKKIRNNQSDKSIKNNKKNNTKKIVNHKKTNKLSKTNKPEKPNKTKNSNKINKKINSSKLFGSIENLKAQSNITNNKATGSNGKSITKNISHKGKLDKYKGKIHDLLYSMPLQNNFSGESIVVELDITSNGMFNYRVIRGSLNPEFLLSFKKYLNQLKKFGFGPTPDGKSLNIKLEFKAKK